MRFAELFPSRHLSAGDLQGPIRLRVEGVTLEPLEDGEPEKPILHLTGCKPLVLNRTNGGVLVEAFGDETDHWRGREVELYPTTTAFRGRMVPAIRLRIPAQAPAYAPPAVPPGMDPAQAAAFAFQAPAQPAPSPPHPGPANPDPWRRP